MTTSHQPLQSGKSAIHNPRMAKMQILYYVVLILGIALLVVTIGMLAVPTVCSLSPRPLNLQPTSGMTQIPDVLVHSIAMKFKYNRTFGSDPRVDNASEAAWNSLVPLGQGSVRYPSDSPNVYTLSVVHQLHCLWSIHNNFYTALQSDSFPPEDHVWSHMRHCFDYLRQSLLCAADVTLEQVDAVLGGVTGWGDPRVCRNYSEVVGWAEEHRVNNLRGFH
ncbi:hypothetical protein F4859DRAFT_513513 [Xylaria cf. heliscus]|nr:hypothetical protein F4859DRAFT_513513 [Xylaria cf. heliscus]